MRAMILLGGAALALSACSGGGNEEANSEGNTLQANTIVVDNAASLDTMNGMDANMTMNGAADPATANAVAQDLTTNTPDANLANGL